MSTQLNKDKLNIKSCTKGRNDYVKIKTYAFYKYVGGLGVLIIFKHETLRNIRRVEHNGG